MALPLLAVGLAAPGSAAARSPGTPSVARPRLVFADGRETPSRGIVFFLKAGSARTVAVGTAHTFPLERIAESARVRFALARSKRDVATSSRFLTRPGKPFDAPGASLRDDHVVFALDSEPRGIQPLALETQRTPVPGMRVALLGIAPEDGSDQTKVHGEIAAVTPDRIEVELDGPLDIRGWGGAPLLLEDSGRVLGILQAHLTRGGRPRLVIASIDGVRESLASPLAGGDGRPFARFAADAGASGEPSRIPSRPKVASASARAKADRGDRPLLPGTPAGSTRVHLEIEYPRDGAVVSDSVCGAFVSGRAIAMRGNVRRFDVIMVIDTSRSTIDPAGTDINGNGVVGKRRLGSLGAIFSTASTDPGDSILAAEVAAARQLLRGLDPRSTRVGVVTFAGEPPESGPAWRRTKAAYTIQSLTREYALVERALDDIVAGEPMGSTHMAAGVDRATVELMGLRGALSQPDPESDKVVFFFTDGQPTLPYGPEAEGDNVRAVLRAAERAKRGRVRIHSFAIGPDALEGPIATVEMANRTDGFFTPVRHPGDLVDVVEEVSFANLDSVELHSVTTGDPASPFRSTADGTWGGFIRMEPGLNRVQVRVRADDGTELTRSIEVHFVPEAPTPPLPRELVVQRNRLLEDCLRETKRLRLEAEREEAERVRRELRVEIERERVRARQRAEEQRKQLQIEVSEE